MLLNCAIVRACTTTTPNVCDISHQRFLRIVVRKAGINEPALPINMLLIMTLWCDLPKQEVVKFSPIPKNH